MTTTETRIDTRKKSVTTPIKVVVLDTCVLRGWVLGQLPEMDDVARLRPPMAIGAITGLELALQLVEKRIPWDKWCSWRERHGDCLSAARPVIQVADDLTMRRASAHARKLATDRDTADAAAIWFRLRGAKTPADIETPALSLNRSGRVIRATFSRTNLAKIIRDEREHWATFVLENARSTRNIAIIQAAVEEHLKAGGAIGEDDRALLDFVDRALVKKGMPTLAGISSMAFVGDDVTERLDAYSRVTARFIFLAVRSKTPYKPEKPNNNDGLDVRQLMVLAVRGAVLCTLDGPLVAAVRDSKSPQLASLLSPTQLLDRLRAERAG